MLQTSHCLGRLAFCFALLLLALQPASQPAWAGDPAVELALGNDGGRPLRCMILFGHWITQDLGMIAPGGAAKVAMWRGQPAGVLYIPRFDGRKMMIENIVCGDDVAWGETLGQVPLLPIRSSGEARFAVACRLAGRVACAEVRLNQ